jgi:CheY-like chemotaxis protein
MRVLIIDDNARFCATVRQLFTAFGHSVVEAQTVTSAHAPLGRSLFDLVVAQLHNTERNAAMIMAVHAQSPTPLLFIGRRGAPEIPDELAGAAESIHRAVLPRGTIRPHRGADDAASRARAPSRRRSLRATHRRVSAG